MPNTQVYGFPYEHPPFSAESNEPGRTLHGGISGDSLILAEEVEKKIQIVDSDLNDNAQQIAALREALSWERIANGFWDGGAFSIPVPVGEFSALKLHLRGHLDGSGTVRLRINDDDTSGLHRTSIWSRTGNSGGLYYNAESDGAPQWQVARWASTAANVATVHMYVTHVTANVGYQSVFAMMSAGIHQNQGIAGGRLNSARLVNSLNIRPFSDAGNLFTSLFWWLEGYREL